MKRRKPETAPSPRTRQSGVAVPDHQACIRFHQGTLSRLEEESRVAVRELCPGQHLPTPQTAGSDQSSDGPSGGVVCLPEAVSSSGDKTITKHKHKGLDSEQMQPKSGCASL